MIDTTYRYGMLCVMIHLWNMVNNPLLFNCSYKLNRDLKLKKGYLFKSGSNIALSKWLILV